MGDSVVQEVDRVRATQIERSDEYGSVEVPRKPREVRETRLVKVSFNLPESEFDALKELAERRQTTATQVVREALMTELYVQELVDSGATLIAKIGRKGRELVFSQMRFGQA